MPAPSLSASILLAIIVAEEDRLPLDWDIDGHFRARILRIGGLPKKNPDSFSADPRDVSADADFGLMRLQLQPVLRYGPDPKNPIASLHVQIDALDDVVFGDNDLIADTPVFGDNLSAVDINGVDIDTIKIERAWLQFLIPIGALRVGRMASHWGLGILSNGGTELDTEFGDPQRASTNDRILFATRPLTIVNVLLNDDDRPTPLVLVAAYDKIVEDPHLELTDPRYDPTEPSRDPLPFGPFSSSDDDVNQIVLAAIWSDKKINREVDTDELTAGFYFTDRSQPSSESSVQIYDFYWRARYSFFGPGSPALFTAGEILTIQGTSRAISEGTLTEPNIWGGVVKLGAEDDWWTFTLEGGYASGDAIIADGEFTSRPLHPNYVVGVVLFPVVLNVRTANQFQSNPSLWSKGGVYDAKYLYPQAKLRFFDGTAEIVAAFLAAWADELTPVLGGSSRDDGTTSCGLFQGDCFLGWEVDTALKVKWGDDDLMRWSTEFGLLKAGTALETAISETLVWSIQSRIAMVF